MIALYSVDNASRSVVLNGLAPDQIAVYDVMGNRVPSSGPAIRFGRQPVYIEGQGITVEALRTAFERGVAWNRPDLVPPNLTINSGPRGSVPAGVVSFAWGATDDTYTADLSDQDAIAYSYSVEGSAGYGGWSAWSGRKSARLAGLPSGQYRFQVKAKDAAGNESPPVSRSFAVGVSLGAGAVSVPLTGPPRGVQQPASGSSPAAGPPAAAVPPPGAGAPPEAPTSQRVTVAGRSLKMRLDGSVQLRLLCGGSAPDGCAGYAWLEQRRRVLGRGRFRIATAESSILRVRLSRRAQRLVRKRGTLRAAVIVTTRGPFGETQKDSKVVTLRSRT